MAGMYDDPTLGIAGVSFNGVRKGFEITGTILPNQDTGLSENEAYRKVQDTNSDGSPKVWAKSGSPKYRLEILLQTELRNWAGTSVEHEEKATTKFPDVVDDGVRRWIAGAMYADKALKDAYKRLGDPEVGGKMTIKVVAMESITIQNGPDAGKSTLVPALKVDWQPATEEGRRIAEKYREEHFEKAEVSSGSGMYDEPQQEEAPPF